MLQSAEKMWASVLSELQNSINKQTYDTWLKDTKAISLNGNTLTVIVQDAIAKDHILQNFNDIICSLLSLNGDNIKISLLLKSDITEQQIQDETTINSLKPNVNENKSISSIYINPKYGFDTFVIGPNNQFAFATAVSVSKAPGKNYNPFFIWGDSGLGKTHLLQAIGNEIIKEKPYLKVHYTSIDDFMNEFIQSILNNTQPSFKIKFKNIDVLLIDDIQFIKNKEGTQDAFFHIFEDLYSNGKQIVISSDRPPKEIPHLVDRLRTRFEWGIITDIKAPNMETREAILRKKAELDKILISDEVLNFIAKRIKSNIRKLESALTQLKAISSFKNENITIEMAKNNLKTLFDEEISKQITIFDIMTKVSERMNISVEDLTSKSRHSSIIQPRFVSIYLCTRLTNLTQSEIGKEFNRDHSTVINARDSIKKLIDKDESFKEFIEDMISDLKS